jgi:GNAT superfamily N-acetyltransferase
MIILKTLSQISDEQSKDVENIFFESSSKTSFKNDDEKNKFKFKYLSYYIENYPDLFIVGMIDKKAVGYICGSPNSYKDKFLLDSLFYFDLFKDEYLKYPAHLHINLSESSRGLGLGSILIKEFESKVSSASCGVHLITSPTARNRGFYLKNEYHHEIIKTYNKTEILLMGKELSIR